MALVATASTRSTPEASRNDENTAAVCTARSIGLLLSTPSSPIPALTRVASRISSASVHQLSGSYWNTTRRNEFEPMSITAMRSTARMMDVGPVGTKGSRLWLPIREQMATFAQTPSRVSTGPHLDNRRIGAALIDLAIPLAIGALAFAAGLSLTPGTAAGGRWGGPSITSSRSSPTAGRRSASGSRSCGWLSADGSPASMEQIAKRTVVRIVDGHIVGLIVMLATGERRVRLGDIVAGTVVADAEESERTTAAATAEAETETPVAKRPRRGRSLKMPSISKPSLRLPSRGGGRATGASADLADLPAAPMPVAPEAEPDPSQSLLRARSRSLRPSRSTRSTEPAQPEHVPRTSPRSIDDYAPHDYYAPRSEDEPEAPQQAGTPEQPEPEEFEELEQLEPDRPWVKPIETVSAIDLVMEDAEERHPDDEPQHDQ